MAALLNNNWLDTDSIVQLLRHPPADITHTRVPFGYATSTVMRGQRRQYDDDCGAWNSLGGRLTNRPYLTIAGSTSLHCVFLCDGQYCVERMADVHTI